MGRIEASHEVEIEAPLERVFEVAADVGSSPLWMPSVETVEVLDTHPDGLPRTVRMQNDAVVRKTTTLLRFDYDAPGGISWEQQEGDPKWLTGQWRLAAITETRTRALYALQTDPGRVLGMLLRGPVEGRVKEFLSKGSAEGLKQQVELG